MVRTLIAAHHNFRRMLSETMNRPRGVTLPDLLLVLATIVLAFLLINWTFSAFAWVSLLVSISALVSAVSALNRQWKVWVPALVLALAGTAFLCAMIPTMYPTRFARLHGTTYERTPLVSVLSDLARQKVDSPTWRFFIWDRDLAQRPVTAAIPDGCRLGAALDAVTKSAGCEYTWHWHKPCGNAPSPLCAVFYIAAPGVRQSDARAEPEVMVFQDYVHYAEQ